MKKWHAFTFFGMWGNMGSDPYMPVFTQQIKKLGVDTHGSPYNDMVATGLIHTINEIPSDEGVFLAGTSLGANNIAIIAYSVRRTIEGMFGFQASSYGAKNYPVQNNVKWAHLISSWNPIPMPFLGTYRWPVGTIVESRYLREWHNIPHPGDYDEGDRAKFLKEMKRCMS